MPRVSLDVSFVIYLIKIDFHHFDDAMNFYIKIIKFSGAYLISTIIDFTLIDVSKYQ